MVEFLLGLQCGYTKFPCFICFWDSRARALHWIRQDWPVRELVPGEKNVQAHPLVERSRIIVPPLHIKLGIMKQFIKTLNKDGDCFKYICTKFLGSMIKLKAGIFDGTQIKTLLNDQDFPNSVNEKESCTWSAFVEAVKNFLENRKAVKYKGIVAKLQSSLQDMGTNMSIKLHFLYSHLDHFPKSLGDLSDEQGEQFHQDINEMEVRYEGSWNAAMLADYCWSIKRDDAFAFHSQRSLKHKFMADISPF